MLNFQLVLTLLLTSIPLFAQDRPVSKDGLLIENLQSKWEVSLSFSHRFNKQVSDVAARREVDPRDIPISRLGLLDTISISGIARVFQTTVPGAFTLDVSDPSFWFGSQLRLHRGLGRHFQLSLGLHYDQRSYNTKDVDGEVISQGVVNTIGKFLYPDARVNESSAGLVVQLDYHLFPENKLHPFFGFGFSGLSNTISRDTRGLIYSPEPEQLISTVSGEVRSNTLDFNFLMAGGLLSQLTPDWQLGITLSSRIGNGSGILGGQLRYAF